MNSWPLRSAAPERRGPLWSGPVPRSRDRRDRPGDRGRRFRATVVAGRLERGAIETCPISGFFAGRAGRWRCSPSTVPQRLGLPFVLWFIAQPPFGKRGSRRLSNDRSLRGPIGPEKQAEERGHPPGIGHPIDVAGAEIQLLGNGPHVAQLPAGRPFGHRNGGHNKSLRGLRHVARRNPRQPKRANYGPQKGPKESLTAEAAA